MAIMETPSRIEPCFLEEAGAEIIDLIASLSTVTERLGNRLKPATAASLADLVRIMNCYYSNLIEGHNTKPREIEQALANKLASSDERRDLQLEALAHIRVQREIDRQYVEGLLPEPASIAFICWIHKAFYEDAPDRMLYIKNITQIIRIEPGQFRSKPEHEVSVGQHLPPSSIYVQNFMEYFQQRYKFEYLGKGSKIIAMAAAHHRFNYIHPFLDGNGRVSRLMSHAMALEAGIGAHALWSVSRGLARGLSSRSDYKQMMDYADTPRQGDLDGRGNLSLKALKAFIVWFLKVCLDQVTFMEKLFELDTLVARLKTYVDLHSLKVEAFYILEAVLMRGELARGEVTRITGLKERTARALLSKLVEAGILASDTPKGAVSLRFPINTAEILFPTLFPVA